MVVLLVYVFHFARSKSKGGAPIQECGAKALALLGCSAVGRQVTTTTANLPACQRPISLPPVPFAHKPQVFTCPPRRRRRRQVWVRAMEDWYAVLAAAIAFCGSLAIYR